MSMQLNVTSYLLVITITIHNEIRQKKGTNPYTHIFAPQTQFWFDFAQIFTRTTKGVEHLRDYRFGTIA